jgi:hypothetical protein
MVVALLIILTLVWVLFVPRTRGDEPPRHDQPAVPVLG